MSSSHQPKLRALTARAVRVPMPQPHRTASGVVAESPLVLTDVTLDNGVIGHSVIFTYTSVALEAATALVRNLEPLQIADGMSDVTGVLGTGVEWNETAVSRFLA